MLLSSLIAKLSLGPPTRARAASLTAKSILASTASVVVSDDPSASLAITSPALGAHHQQVRHYNIRNIVADPVPTRSKINKKRKHQSNRARLGLYDGKDVRSGNYVSHAGNRTKRKFKPNVFHKRLWSETLDEWIRFKVTASALKSMDHMGGLDEYLLHSRHVKDGLGLEVRRKIVTRMEQNEKQRLLELAIQQEMEDNSLVPPDDDDDDDDGGTEEESKGTTSKIE
uniref:Large ribosomal subunit protein bL28c n=1 Tax=Grammatophora oceanica TaxID=210454 RepID=A0A7S1Y201_9STRA|mmetsp:Transcript_19541/g.28914  ORF Transcript_19541/g.28914 Transcript_19541/m.28914 type:complete len:227 (+) Transcript_19541:69-749(+)